VNGYFVGFEDIFGGGDADYNDHRDVVSGVERSRCPRSQGYWKNHTQAWPVNTLQLGSQNYTMAELLALLTSPTRGDASLILSKQLIAAKLNILNFADPAPAAAAITAADLLLATFVGKLPYGVASSSAAGATMTSLGAILDSYNNGRLTSSCACPG